MRDENHEMVYEKKKKLRMLLLDLIFSYFFSPQNWKLMWNLIEKLYQPSNEFLVNLFFQQARFYIIYLTFVFVLIILVKLYFTFLKKKSRKF